MPLRRVTGKSALPSSGRWKLGRSRGHQEGYPRGRRDPIRITDAVGFGRNRPRRAAFRGHRVELGLGSKAGLDGTSASHPMKSTVVGFRGNPRVIAVHHRERGTASLAAPAGARAAGHQGPFRPLGPKAPASRQWRPNRRIFEDAASDRASNLRSAAQVCTAIRSTVVLSLAARPLADHFSPSPMVGSRGSAAPALIPTILAGRLVHEFTRSGSHGAEPSSRIGRGGFDYHGRACLRPET
jgi:hypothetical protein